MRDSKMKLNCVHYPKCPGKARVYAKFGGTAWLICLKCRMSFPDTDRKRKR